VRIGLREGRVGVGEVADDAGEDGNEGGLASRRLLRDFKQGLTDRGSPSPNFEDGLRTQAMLDAARESSASERVVELAEVG